MSMGAVSMDDVFDRRDLIDRICEVLQRDYVSLLGQRGSGLEMFLKMLVKGSPSSTTTMKLILITIPEGIPDEEDPFNKMLLDRLLESVNELPSGKTLRTEIEKKIATMQDNAQVRLHLAFETLGQKTVARPLVIVLQAISLAPKNSLRNFLLMLRDYHRQIDVEGAAGEYLRFLVAGDLRLWLLSLHLEDSLNISAFDIAKRIFLSGLSYREIAALDVFADIEYAIYAKNLTDGIPSLIHRVGELKRSSNTLLPFFDLLQSRWNWLPDASKQALKMLAEDPGHAPRYIHDYECPAIPKLEPPWLEAFWKGFLRVHLRELTWRSPIHQAFVMHNTQLEGDTSKAIMMRRNQLEGLRRFTKLMRRICEDESIDDYLEEALLLTLPTKGALLAPLLKQLCLGAEKSEIMQQVREVIANTDKRWLKELEEHIEEESFVEFLVAATLWESRRLLEDFDVFLHYDDEDLSLVKAIAEQLLEHGILPRLKVWEVPSGGHVQPQQIAHIRSVIIFFGKNGMGPGQSEEVGKFLSSLEPGFSVVHVILANAPQAMERQLSPFSIEKAWIDFREPNSLPMKQLVLAIAGKQAPTKTAHQVLDTLKIKELDNHLVNLNTLRKAMLTAFNLGELEVLCAKLDARYDDLGEGSLEVKIQRLIELCRRLGMYEKLVDQVLKDRPQLKDILERGSI
jgi:hypothetical protein